MSCESSNELNRNIVQNDYHTAININKEKFAQGHPKATEEYIFENQKEDALQIVDKFYSTSIRGISIIKRTKVGMDGLMIEIAVRMSSHSDDSFLIHRNNIFMITAMNNLLWEIDLKDKVPNCFRDNVYHHGKLQQLSKKLKNIKNALIIIDEIDTGDKEDQKLHLLLKVSGILDMRYMEENNIRFIFVSATMIQELRELYKWGDKHDFFYMSIPKTYIGHEEFLTKGIIQEFYPIHDLKSAEKWVMEDILANYGMDYRVHFIRTDERYKHFILNACIKHKIVFHNHTSLDRITDEDFYSIFQNINNHVVIAVKGLLRRSTLIPNMYKLRIGATHERYTKRHDTNVQVQGLPGRMTGYWRKDILNGHKTGPHRTSIKAITEYEQYYKDPFGNFKYRTNSTKDVFVSPKYIANMDEKGVHKRADSKSYRVYKDEKVVKSVCRKLGYEYRATKENKEGFKETSLNKKRAVVSLSEAISKVPTAYGNRDGIVTWRTYFPCYKDINDNSTLRFVVIIRPDTDRTKLSFVDTEYLSEN
jgi:hypothetical protein